MFGFDPIDYACMYKVLEPMFAGAGVVFMFLALLCYLRERGNGPYGEALCLEDDARELMG